MANTPKPKPTAMQIGLMLLGGAIAAVLTMGVLGIGGAIGGGLIGLGVAIGAWPYLRAVQEWQKTQQN